MSKIIVIVGPTGVGKTKYSIDLAKKYNASVINADSVQIYKDFNIATAKITEDEKQGIKHYFLDYLLPDMNYSVADYQKDARIVLNSLINENKNIIIVGGTGLYIKALLYDYNFIKYEKTSDFNYEKYTNKELKTKVNDIYKENNIHINNRKRLIRFLEEYKNNNKIIKNTENKDKLLYENVYLIGLTTSRELLYENINNRVESMFNDGLLEEAKYFYTNKINKCNEIIGYKELFMYFDNKISLEEAKEKIKQNTRKYAKRQYTWFNNQMNVKWFDIKNNSIDDIINYIN